MISNNTDIEIIKTTDSRINQFDPQNIQFGKFEAGMDAIYCVNLYKVIL